MAERKKYIDVRIPILDSSLRVLGTFETLRDKTIKLDLTRKMRGKGLMATFRILGKEKELYAVPNRLELVKTYIQRMIRKRVDYVEDSFRSRCADVAITIKPFLITRKRVSRAVRKNLRNTCREFLLENIKEKNYLDICNEILDGSLQKSMLPRLKKIYPLSFCDLRIFETKEIDKIAPQKDLKLESEVETIKEETEEIKSQIEEIDEEVKKEETLKKEKKPRKKKEEKSSEE